MARAPQKPPVKQITLQQLEALFPTDDHCKTYLAGARWGGTVRCPRCGHDKVYVLTFKAFHWQCHKCAEHGYRFSVLTGTIFENTNVPLTLWFKVIWMMMTAKKGISALQIQRTLGFGSYRTAWSMCHRIRAGMADESFQQLTGFVEMDESFIGGKEHNKHLNKRGKSDGTGSSEGGRGKMIVAGAVQRGGNVVARVIERCDSRTLGSFIKEAISHKVSVLATDDWRGYPWYLAHGEHKVINHKKREYVVGALHTNTIEGFWSQMKRGFVGTFHKVTKKYLPLYVAEFAFRYNNRKNPDIFGAAVATV